MLLLAEWGVTPRTHLLRVVTGKDNCLWGRLGGIYTDQADRQLLDTVSLHSAQWDNTGGRRSCSIVSSFLSLLEVKGINFLENFYRLLWWDNDVTPWWPTVELRPEYRRGGHCVDQTNNFVFMMILKKKLFIYWTELDSKLKKIRFLKNEILIIRPIQIELHYSQESLISPKEFLFKWNLGKISLNRHNPFDRERLRLEFKRELEEWVTSVGYRSVKTCV